MIKEIFKENFPFNKEFVFLYKSTKYLDVISKYNEDNNLVFEFKVKEFKEPFVGKYTRKLFEDYKGNSRFFVYLNQNKHESAIFSIGRLPIDICKIFDIFVEPTFQNLGIGTELLRIADAIAKKWSAKAIVIEIQSNNFPAIRFFQKNGYMITGFNLINNSRDDYKRHDFLILMSKILD